MEKNTEIISSKVKNERRMTILITLNPYNTWYFYKKNKEVKEKLNTNRKK